jgi:hypothetical protein
MSAQKPSYVTAVTLPLIFASLFVVGAIVSAILALHLLRSADTPRKTRGADYRPEIMLITNERHVTASLQLSYYGGYSSSIGLLTPTGGQSGAFPIGVRYITIAFRGGESGRTLQYALLLNQDASESKIYGLPFANSRHLPQNPISVGSPGKVIINNCELPENTRFTQIMYGDVSVTSNGTADTQIAGRLINQHPYLTTGNADIVNVVEMLPTASAMMTADAGCKWLFPDSPFLGGLRWYSPTTLTGSVNIGSLRGDYTVQSSNPTLEDLSSLYWEFSGPNAINYILTDNSITRHASDDLFLAGVFASVAAVLGVEFLKTCFEVRAEVRGVRERREILEEREEGKREREKENDVAARLIPVILEVRSELARVLEVAKRPTLARRLASKFRRRQGVPCSSNHLRPGSDRSND